MPDDPTPEAEEAAPTYRRPKGNKGRDSLLTPEVQNAIVALVRAGNFVGTAAQASGIPASSVRVWLKRGRDAIERPSRSEHKRELDAPYVIFYNVLSRARADARTAMVMTVQVAAKDDWRAAAWYLEKTDPQHFGAKLEIRLNPQRIRAVAEAEGIDPQELALEMQHLAIAATAPDPAASGAVGEFEERDFV